MGGTPVHGANRSRGSGTLVLRAVVRQTHGTGRGLLTNPPATGGTALSSAGKTAVGWPGSQASAAHVGGCGGHCRLGVQTAQAWMEAAFGDRWLERGHGDHCGLGLQGRQRDREPLGGREASMVPRRTRAGRG